MNRLTLLHDDEPTPVPIRVWTVRWVFINGHVWTKTFFSHEDATNWVDYCELTTDPNITSWSISEEVV
jgi:hypothetical protein